MFPCSTGAKMAAAVMSRQWLGFFCSIECSVMCIQVLSGSSCSGRLLGENTELQRSLSALKWVCKLCVCVCVCVCFCAAAVSSDVMCGLQPPSLLCNMKRRFWQKRINIESADIPKSALNIIWSWVWLQIGLHHMFFLFLLLWIYSDTSQAHIYQHVTVGCTSTLSTS